MSIRQNKKIYYIYVHKTTTSFIHSRLYKKSEKKWLWRCDALDSFFPWTFFDQWPHNNQQNMTSWKNSGDRRESWKTQWTTSTLWNLSGHLHTLQQTNNIFFVSSEEKNVPIPVVVRSHCDWPCYQKRACQLATFKKCWPEKGFV